VRASTPIPSATRALAAAVAIAAPFGVPSAQAQNKTYGEVTLLDLARESWPLNPPMVQSAMVCNVDGPDGFLSIRSGPGTTHVVNRRLKRLAIVDVDTSERRGRWVKVVTAYRTHTDQGERRAYKSLHVTGWAHDGYLCSFLD